MFAGSTSAAISHFTSPEVGFLFDPDINPAEFILDACGGSLVPSLSTSGKQQSDPYTAESLSRLFQSSVYRIEPPVYASSESAHDNNG